MLCLLLWGQHRAVAVAACLSCSGPLMFTPPLTPLLASCAQRSLAASDEGLAASARTGSSAGAASASDPSAQLPSMSQRMNTEALVQASAGSEGARVPSRWCGQHKC
jgi:hypothetical protein